MSTPGPLNVFESIKVQEQKIIDENNEQIKKYKKETYEHFYKQFNEENVIKDIAKYKVDNPNCKHIYIYFKHNINWSDIPYYDHYYLYDLFEKELKVMGFDACKVQKYQSFAVRGQQMEYKIRIVNPDYKSSCCIN